MLSVGELDDLPGTGETVNALLHVEWQSSQLLLGHNMVKGADLLLQLSNDQVVRGKVQNVPQRVPADQIRVL